MFSFKIDPVGHDLTNVEEEYEPAVFIFCKNCSTLHDLGDFIKREKED